MDLLTDLLQQAGLRRRLLDVRQLGSATPLRFPCEKSIGLHVVTQGPVYVHAPAFAAPLVLGAGDIAVMARGCEHVLSTQPMVRADAVRTIGHAEPEPDAGEQAAAPSGSATGASAVISGAYQLWNPPVHPFFREMPAWFVMRADEIPKLGALSLTVALLAEEVGRRELGADTVLHGLLDVIFTYLLREQVRRQGVQGASWAHAVRDLPVRRALALMHADCARAWTLEALAAHAGLSRTGLAERFRQAMGDTPLSYLRTVRMQQAMRLLSESDKTLEQVAREVGYQDAFSFSKVFKRSVGLAPRDFRRRDDADKQLAWRFKSV